jgi:hypothetical protein
MWEATAVAALKYLPSTQIKSTKYKTAMQTAMDFITPSDPNEGV